MRASRWLPAVVLVGVCAGTLLASQAAIRGKVHDPQGRPLEGVSVTASDGGEFASSDAAGAFALNLPSAGQARLRFELAGYYPESISLDGNRASALEVVLTPRILVKQEVRIVEPRLDIPVPVNPAATSLVGADMLHAMPRGIAVDEALMSVPGVKVDNQADGERVHMSIRGQGILSERGIRGIQVLLDRVPLNDPSGFVPDLFDVDWAGVQEVEVIRGPVAFLYGGGSAGGVVDIHTREAEGPTHAEFSSGGGANGFYKTRAEVSAGHGGFAYFLSASRNAGDGYRQHTGFWGDNLEAKLDFKPTSTFSLNAVLLGTGFFNQNAEGLNLTWLAQDRRMANPDALIYNEFQKTVRFTGALTGQWTASERQRLSFTVFTRRTQYDEPVPSSVDHRSLNAAGGSLQYDLQGDLGGAKHRFSAGVDLDSQFIDEHRHPNLGDAVEGPDLLSNQSITQSRVAGYASDRISLGSQWTVLLGARVDRMSNQLDDALRAGGLDLSGNRDFTRGTGRVGVSWNPRNEVGLYASWGQGFLPPATEELDANPAALGGFNRALVPASSSGFEVGARGSLGRRVYYDAAVFRLDTKNDFERYRIASRPLETFYRNAGQSRRYGLETSARWLPANRVILSGAYTYSHFVYSHYDSLTYPGNLTGNRLPNSPVHQVFFDANLEMPAGFTLGAGAQTFSRAFVDATNRSWIGAYGLLHARISKGWQRGRTYSTLSFHARNLTGQDYIAFTEPDPDGNSYQPGPGRELFVGVRVQF